MSFNRSRLLQGRTLAWRLFKRHHTHFNQIYWSHKAAKAFAYAATKSKSETDLTASLFPYAASTPRVPERLGEWAICYSDFDKWTQMASVIAISGYLETFLAQVSTAALESCPSLLFGGGPKVDGAIYLKSNEKYDLYNHSESLVRGDWQARISAYKRYFNACPFEVYISELEKLRKLRNNAGHSFGRNIESMRFAGTWMLQKLPNISDEDLQAHLRIVDSVAVLVEAHLAPMVGQYELIKIFHRWLNARTGIRPEAKILAREFSAHVHELTGTSYGKLRAMNLIRYYDSI